VGLGGTFQVADQNKKRLPPVKGIGCLKKHGRSEGAV
jgi:hypothetical protein